MSKKRDHLNDCLERLLKGEELESCLKDYPEEAEELRLLLKTADGIRYYTENAKPRPQFIKETKAILGLAYQQKYYSRKTQTAGIRKPVMRLAAATALALAIVVVTLTGGFALSVRASENTMPGDTLYPIKLVSEQVRLTFAFAHDKKVSYLTQFAETRAEEMAYSAQQGDYIQVEAALERLEGYLTKVASREYELQELQRIESIVQASSARARAKLDEIGEPAPQDKVVEPATQNTAEKPAPQNTVEVPATQNTVVEPAPQNTVEKPAQQDTVEKPAPQNKVEKPAPQNKVEKPAPQDKDKIIDRVDKAYLKTIEAIKLTKADKPGKTGK